MKATASQPVAVTKDTIGQYLTLPKPKPMPNNYNEMIAAKTSCEGQGGSFSINGCYFPPPPPPPVYVPSNCPLAAAGIDASNPYVMLVINRESGCNAHAMNGSGACGVAQSLPCGKPSPSGIVCPYYNFDTVCELKWMQDYVMNRYGSWANAWQNELNYGWY